MPVSNENAGNFANALVALLRRGLEVGKLLEIESLVSKFGQRGEDTPESRLAGFVYDMIRVANR